MDNRKIACRQNAECVIGDVRECVAACRRNGIGTVKALSRLAATWQMAGRRLRTIFYRDQDLSVQDDERLRLALAAASFLHRIADENEEKARQCRAKAEAIRLRELQQQILPLGGSAWRDYGRGYGNSKHRHAA